jgi:hypothetical protein
VRPAVEWVRGAGLARPKLGVERVAVLGRGGNRGAWSGAGGASWGQVGADWWGRPVLAQAELVRRLAAVEAQVGACARGSESAAWDAGEQGKAMGSWCGQLARCGRAMCWRGADAVGAAREGMAAESWTRSEQVERGWAQAERAGGRCALVGRGAGARAGRCGQVEASRSSSRAREGVRRGRGGGSSEAKRR